jgi:hypothetical protein
VSTILDGVGEGCLRVLSNRFARLSVPGVAVCAFCST